MPGSIFASSLQVTLPFFGSKRIIAEFAAGLLLCGALGMLVLFQRDSFTQLVLGTYLIALSINYVPMLIYAIGISRNRVRPRSWARR